LGFSFCQLEGHIIVDRAKSSALAVILELIGWTDFPCVSILEDHQITPATGRLIGIDFHGDTGISQLC
jgi:hypothetical protein